MPLLQQETETKACNFNMKYKTVLDASTPAGDGKNASVKKQLV
jgi:hypothetical protein